MADIVNSDGRHCQRVRRMESITARDTSWRQLAGGGLRAVEFLWRCTQKVFRSQAQESSPQAFGHARGNVCVVSLACPPSIHRRTPLFFLGTSCPPLRISGLSYRCRTTTREAQLRCSFWWAISH